MKIIDVMNTIVSFSRSLSCSRSQLLEGHNTDWRGIEFYFRNAGTRPSNGLSGLLVGSGGTARAAVYALHAMGYAPLILLRRWPEKLNSVVELFPPAYNIRPVTNKEEATGIHIDSLTVIIGTISAHTPIDKTMAASSRHV